MRRALRHSLVASLLLAAMACGGTPPPIDYGVQGCDYCRMQIDDPRYGGQVITTTGKSYAFDSVECLAAFAESFDASRVRMIRVADFSDPGRLIPVAEARFYQDPQRGGPMGGGWLAVSADADSAWLASNVRGTPAEWEAVRQLAQVSHPAGDAMPPLEDDHGAR